MQVALLKVKVKSGSTGTHHGDLNWERDNHFLPLLNEVTLKSHLYFSLIDLRNYKTSISSYTISNIDLGEDISGT